MHSAPMREDEGTFRDDWRPAVLERDDGSTFIATCRKCKGRDVVFRVWESNCGGYEDVKYRCKDCGEVWWVDGPDS